jgi:hypothetical protein
MKRALPIDIIKIRILFLLNSSAMRFLFLLVLVANVALLAYGQGFFGVPPNEQGRQPRTLQENHQAAISLGTPLETRQTIK